MCNNLKGHVLPVVPFGLDPFFSLIKKKKICFAWGWLNDYTRMTNFCYSIDMLINVGS